MYFNSLLSFLTTFNADEYANWIELTAADRAAVKAEYAAAGISLCVSAFGSTTEPTTAGLDPVEWADMIAAAVRSCSTSLSMTSLNLYTGHRVRPGWR